MVGSEQENTNCSKVSKNEWELQFNCVEERLNCSQRGEVTDWIDTAPQQFAGVFASHPLGDRDVISVALDLKEKCWTATDPLDNSKLPPEKRVQRVLDRYHTLVTGIIMFALASPATSQTSEQLGNVAHIS